MSTQTTRPRHPRHSQCVAGNLVKPLTSSNVEEKNERIKETEAAQLFSRVVLVLSSGNETCYSSKISVSLLPLAFWHCRLPLSIMEGMTTYDLLPLFSKVPLLIVICHYSGCCVCCILDVLFLIHLTFLSDIGDRTRMGRLTQVILPISSRRFPLTVRYSLFKPQKSSFYI
jgi:hypothetical protein